MGEVYLKGDRLGFRYDDSWQTDSSAFPLSLSMPLVREHHEHRVVEAFLWGLLPDNGNVLERWGRRFRVSARNPFRLLQHVGEDCAGGVQFVRPDRVDPLLSGRGEPRIQWLTEEDLAVRISDVVADASATRRGEDGGQFSLAGAQPKLALYRERGTGRWGVPEGRTPTTHILKPANGAFDGQTENEHFCLRLAAELGFSTARSSVLACGNIPVIVVERYDRREKDGQVRRVHQEDFCQACAVRPQSKYQNEGGPSPRMMGEVINSFSSSSGVDMERFAEALIFHWLTGGTDAHAKNYSMLLAAGSQARLAPLYDLATALPYPRQIPPRKATMAMKIGSHYRIQEISRMDWEKLARELLLSPQVVLGKIMEMAERLPTAADSVALSMAENGIEHPVIRLILEKLPVHIGKCLKGLK